MAKVETRFSVGDRAYYRTSDGKGLGALDIHSVHIDMNSDGVHVGYYGEEATGYLFSEEDLLGKSEAKQVLKELHQNRIWDLFGEEEAQKAKAEEATP
jgi:hypothetical protein